MLDRNVIFAGVAPCGGGERLLGLTARLRRRKNRLDWIGRRFHWSGGLAPTIDIRDVRILLVSHPHQRRCKTRDLRRFGDNERDRLAIEDDPAVVERPERRPCGGYRILVCLIVIP